MAALTPRRGERRRSEEGMSKPAPNWRCCRGERRGDCCSARHAAIDWFDAQCDGVGLTTFLPFICCFDSARMASVDWYLGQPPRQSRHGVAGHPIFSQERSRSLVSLVSRAASSLRGATHAKWLEIFIPQQQISSPGERARLPRFLMFLRNRAQNRLRISKRRFLRLQILL